MRLDSYMAQSGVCARRKAKELICEGHVTVNDKIVTDVSLKICDTDCVCVDGRKVQPITEHVYIMLNKPEGMVSSSREKNQVTVTDFVKIRQRVYNVGRLDRETTGLIVLTTDGILAHSLLNPRARVPKLYKVVVKGILTQREMTRLMTGFYVPYIGRVMPARVKSVWKSRQESCVEVEIYEGKNRQIRRMFYHLGHPVKKLERIGFACLKLGNLPKGKWIYLKDHQIHALKQFVLDCQQNKKATPRRRTLRSGRCSDLNEKV